jgi:hypothetical protein
MTILLSQAVRVGGVVLAAGTTQTLAADLEADLVTRKIATYTVAPMKSTVPLFWENDPLTGGLEILDPVTKLPMELGVSLQTSGSTAVGGVRTATLSDGWAATSYQWTRNNVAISGATSASYTLVQADMGKSIRCQAAVVRISDGVVVPLVLSSAVMLDAFQSSGAAGYTFSANTNVADYNGGQAGEGKVRLTGNGTSVTLFARKTTTQSLTPANMGVIAYMINRLNGVAGLTAAMTRGAATGTLAFTDTDTTYRKGRRWIAADNSEFGTFSTGADGTVQYQISANQNAGYTTDVVIGPLLYNAAGRPTIVFTFDDCSDTQYSNVFPEFQSRGFPATIYAVKNSVGTGGRLTVANLQEMYAAGWDVGTNTQADGPITAFASDADCVADLAGVKSWLTANGMPRAVNHMALSNGAWSESRLAALQADGMITGRTTVSGDFYTRYGFGDQAMTMAGQALAGQTLVALKAFVDKAILRGTNFVFYTHAVSPGASGGNTDLTILTDLLDYIKTKTDAGLLDVLTISQLWARDGANTAPV